MAKKPARLTEARPLTITSAFQQTGSANHPHFGRNAPTKMPTLISPLVGRAILAVCIFVTTVALTIHFFGH